MSDNNGSAAAGNPGAQASGGEGAAAGAGAGAGEGQAAAGTGAAANAPWYGSVADAELKGFAELKGWDSPDKAIESYRNLEKFQGVPADRLLKIPEAGDVDGMKAINEKFGWAPPAKPEDYALPVPEGMQDTFAKVASAEFHKLGVPKDMAVKIAEFANAFTLTQMEAENTAINTQHNSELAALKTEWGANFDPLVETGKRAIAEYMPKTGLTDADMDALRDTLGTAKFNKLWAGIGSTMGEAAFVDGASVAAPGQMTPEAALVRRGQLTNDAEWFKRFQAGDMKAVNEWNAVTSVLNHAAANTGQVR